MTKEVVCLKCNAHIKHNPRQIQGCVCDPDAPTWVYIQPDGVVKGFSQSEWREVTDGEEVQ